MVFLQQAFGFLVIAVGIQSALSRVCPILCTDDYKPICGLNQIGRIKQIFPNQCSLDVAICLNGKPYDDVEWQPCTLGQLMTGSSIDFQFGNNADDGTNFNFNGNDNENGIIVWFPIQTNCNI
ncbi:vasotab-like [Chrysoperla carnea]|uniref:vasotab-like n=1 Tax=Chrysoperla carnea TaxID=189513 RepID=UPI001D0619B1|nr:vasotab-like [Chrysoperla carnea]